MAKQCPSTSGTPHLWERRIFKNTYVRNGETREVRGWAIRLQWQGKRKTFSLSAPGRRAAAAEARQIHETLLRQGWDAALRLHRSFRFPEMTGAQSASDQALKEQPLYWNQRLMKRKYTEHASVEANRELSVRMGDESNQFWFPLGTDLEAQAAERALDIYRTLQAEGWRGVCEKYSREITIAIFWAVNPVAVTYTTIHTIVAEHGPAIAALAHRRDFLRKSRNGGGYEIAAHPARRDKPAVPPTSKSAGPGKLENMAQLRRVAVIEPDAGIQRALRFWLNRQPGIQCVATATNLEELLQSNGGTRPELVLLNRALPGAATADVMQSLNERSPELPVFTYAISEDIDQIFISLSGVKAGYIFRRRIPSELLEPLQGALNQDPFTVKQVGHHLRNYFSNLFEFGGSIGGSPRIANLTAREGEILNLLSKGCVDKEIAEALRISVWTVHTHLRKIYEKLQVHTRTEAVVKYLGK